MSFNELPGAAWGGGALMPENGAVEADSGELSASGFAPVDTIEPVVADGEGVIEDLPAPDDEPASAPTPADAADLLAGMSQAVQRLADAAERYHARAEQRESVIAHLSSEVDRLRRGDRREILRPVLTELCRLRNDLLRQAHGLPDDFSADRATLLLRSYADSVEMLLDANGIATFSADTGDAFDPRMHRRVSGEPAADAAVAGRIAGVRKDGYLDLETGKPLAPAEVVIFTVSATETAGQPAPGAEPDVTSGSAGEANGATDGRNEQ
jgi:molecular chaperone GrpE (heat shock protein)